MNRMISTNFVSLTNVMPFCHLSDEDFHLALYEQQNGSIHFDQDRLASLRFNSLLSERSKQLSLCYDQDPDANFYETFLCDYYNEEKFNDLVTLSFADEFLSALHLNT